MENDAVYTTKLAAGSGAIDETLILLDEWNPGMKPNELLDKVLQEGRFSNISARRLKNIVLECFSHRYLVNDNYPALILKQLKDQINLGTFTQFLFLYTARANRMLFDFVTKVYWSAYAGGQRQISNHIANNFVKDANSNGKTERFWSDETIERQAGYLTRTCADFGLLGKGRKSVRSIESFRSTRQIAAFLAYDLHFSGLGDNAVMKAEDWHLFGLGGYDVQQEIASISRTGMFLFQRAGEAVKIGWKYKTMEEVIDGIVRI